MEKSSDNLNIENNTFANCGKTETLNAVEAIKCTDTVEQNNKFTEEKMIDLFKKEEYNEE